MPVLDASALNDNDDALAFLRAVLVPREGARTESHAGRRFFCLFRRPASQQPLMLGIPLIVGVVVSISMAMR